MIAGANVTITPVDNAGTSSTDITLAASGGGGGGTVDAPTLSNALYISDGGTADLYSGNATPSVTSLTDSLIVNVRVAHTNTSISPTFNLNSLGAKVIKHTDGTPLAVGELVTNGEALLVYYSAGNSWHLLNSPPQPIPPQSAASSRDQFLKSNGASLSFSMNPVSPGSGRRVAFAIPDGAVTAIGTGKGYLGMWVRSSGLTPAASEVWTPCPASTISLD